MSIWLLMTIITLHHLCFGHCVNSSVIVLGLCMVQNNHLQINKCPRFGNFRPPPSFETCKKMIPQKFNMFNFTVTGTPKYGNCSLYDLKLTVMSTCILLGALSKHTKIRTSSKIIRICLVGKFIKITLRWGVNKLSSIRNKEVTTIKCSKMGPISNTESIPKTDLV